MTNDTIASRGENGGKRSTEGRVTSYYISINQNMSDLSAQNSSQIMRRLANNRTTATPSGQ